MSRFVVLFGPPGCGKGTQAARLKDALQVPHISTGDMFRDHKARRTPLGLQVEAILAAGQLVGDDVTNSMVEERLERNDVAEGAVLDGYPRSVAQAEVLDRILAAHMRSVGDVVVIDVPHDELVRRLLERGKASGRADDQDPDTINRRLGVYGEQSEPCIGFYERTGRRVHHVAGVGSVDDVTARILAVVGSPTPPASSPAAPGGGRAPSTPRSSKPTAAKAKATAVKATKAKVKKPTAPKKKAKKAAPKKTKPVAARAKKVQTTVKKSKKKVRKAKAGGARRAAKRR
jgi:adenylate kinase